MNRIYPSRPTHWTPRKHMFTMECASYHRPSPELSTYGDDIAPTQRKTTNDYTFTYQFDAHVWAYINHEIYGE